MNATIITNSTLAGVQAAFNALVGSPTFIRPIFVEMTQTPVTGSFNVLIITH